MVRSQLHRLPRIDAHGAIDLDAVLLLPALHSGLRLLAVAAVDAGADLLLDLADRRTIRLPVARMDGRTLVLGVVEVALGQRERGPLARCRLLRLPAIDDSPRLVADHAVRGEAVGFLPLLRLGHRGRAPVPVSV